MNTHLPAARNRLGTLSDVRTTPPTGGHAVRPHVVAICAFAIGSSLAMSFAFSSWGGGVRGGIVVTLLAAVCTGAWMACALSGAATRSLRWVGRAAWMFLIACFTLWVYLAISFGVLLAWTVPRWAFVPLALAAVAAAATALRRRDRLHIPVVLPIGMWIAIVLSGWLREEHWLRCDDFLALRPPVQLVVPSDAHLASCRRGEVRPSGRFPRTIWEAPNGKRLIFTTISSSTQRESTSISRLLSSMVADQLDERRRATIASSPPWLQQ